MGDKKTSEPKMKASVVVHPHTGKQIAIFVMMIITIIISVVPFINLVNVPTLVFGMPLLMVWSILIVLLSFVILQLARKWKVY